jgi:hypothetical protein
MQRFVTPGQLFLCKSAEPAGENTGCHASDQKAAKRIGEWIQWRDSRLTKRQAVASLGSAPHATLRHANGLNIEEIQEFIITRSVSEGFWEDCPNANTQSLTVISGCDVGNCATSKKMQQGIPENNAQNAIPHLRFGL